MRYARTLVLCFGAVLSTGCPTGKITIPAADATPPEITLLVTQERGNSSSTVLSINGSSPQPAPIPAQRADAYIFSATGKDPEGTKETQIWVSYTFWRTNPDGTGTQIGPGLLTTPAARSVDNSQPGGTGYVERPVLHTVEIAEELQKQPGASSMRMETWAVALNYHGAQVQTPKVTVNWP